ncbi:ADM_collapsed_G0022310.mRNA.1.CDS.1 [Saccharomyces cerevisiae]|nr:ADM_collapsed_G0022310.mRNA.1.CDS.1 [Saccharomyces cerevisiae]
MAATQMLEVSTEVQVLLQRDHVTSKFSIIGSAFSHQEFWHLGMNMLALWSFGTFTRNNVGSIQFSPYMN